MRFNMRTAKASIRKLLLLAFIALVVIQLAGCDGPGSRPYGGTAPSSRPLISLPHAAPGPYLMLFVDSDNNLWEYEDGGIWQLDDRSKIGIQPIVKLLDDVVHMDYTPSGRIALKSDNSLWLLDDGVDEPNKYWAVKLADGIQYVTSSGSGMLLTVNTDGTAWQWFGLGEGEARYSSVMAKHGLEGAVKISAGRDHFLALQEGGRLWAWGAESGYMDSLRGVVGSGEPQIVRDENVEQIYAADGYSMFIDSDGVLWGWGRNEGGQLGDGTTENRTSPIKITEDAVMVSTGMYAVFAVKTDGSLWGWGDYVGSHTPVLIMEGDPNAGIVQVTEGNYADGACLYVLKSDNSLYIAERLSTGSFEDEVRYYDLPPEKAMDDVLYVDGGHAVKTDGSIWDTHREIMVLPPGTALTDRQE
jgi:hypothetical protein